MTDKPDDASGQVRKVTEDYMASRLLAVGLTKDEALNNNDPVFKLDEGEISHIMGDKAWFDAWLEHVHTHKLLKALENVPVMEKPVGPPKDCTGVNSHHYINAIKDLDSLFKSRGIKRKKP